MDVEAVRAGEPVQADAEALADGGQRVAAVDAIASSPARPGAPVDVRGAVVARGMGVNPAVARDAKRRPRDGEGPAAAGRSPAQGCEG